MYIISTSGYIEAADVPPIAINMVTGFGATFILNSIRHRQRSSVIRISNALLMLTLLAWSISSVILHITYFSRTYRSYLFQHWQISLLFRFLEFSLTYHKRNETETVRLGLLNTKFTFLMVYTGCQEKFLRGASSELLGCWREDVGFVFPLFP